MAQDVISIILVIAICAVVFFGLGVVAGFHAGFNAGRRNATDEIQPSYDIIVTKLAQTSDLKYRDLNREQR